MCAHTQRTTNKRLRTQTQDWPTRNQFALEGLCYFPSWRACLISKAAGKVRLFLGCFSTPDGHRQQQQPEEEEIKKKKKIAEKMLMSWAELQNWRVSVDCRSVNAQPIKHNHHIFIICSETNKTVGNYTNVEMRLCVCVYFKNFRKSNNFTLEGRRKKSFDVEFSDAKWNLKKLPHGTKQLRVIWIWRGEVKEENGELRFFCFVWINNNNKTGERKTRMFPI